MRVLITGGAGFLGVALARALLQRGYLTSGDGKKTPITNLVLCDVILPPDDLAGHPLVTLKQCDITNPEALEATCTSDIASIFHLAALVSGGAEQDFPAGMEVNLLGTLKLLERCRTNGNCPRFVFTSSIASYGGDLPYIIDDHQYLTPQSSYGTQKVIGEKLINEYSRKGFIDGRSVRLPIIVVRPGGSNTATSSWASAIIREPLFGNDYVCPVEPDDTAFVLSGRKVIEGIILAHDSPAKVWGADRSLMMPGLVSSARDMVTALERVAGKEVAGRVGWRSDPFIRDIVNTWPTRFTLHKAQRIGLQADESLEEIINCYIAEELMGATDGAQQKKENSQAMPSKKVTEKTITGRN